MNRAGRLGLAAVCMLSGGTLIAEAGPLVRQDRVKPVSVASETIARYQVPGCRIEKTLKYDFHGNLYVKKVRICA